MMVRGAQDAAHPVRPCPKTTSRLRCLSFLIIAIVVVAGNAQEMQDASALLKFKSSLANVEPSLASWDLSKSPPCSGNHANWRGVICFNGYVWGLQLENMDLRGQIDVNALVPLPYLRTLSFMNNNFEGKMPDWRKLGALKSLFLSNNQFSGQIPEDAFKGMTSLKKVYMANNKLTGHIPASLESPKLIELSLQNNQFTGTIPPISSDHLKLFNVANNQLEGPIPAPLLKFGPSSFAGNKALCGKNLESKCNPPIPPPESEPPLGSPPVEIPNTTTAAKDNKSSPARIAIIVVSILVGLFLITLLLVMLYRRNHQSQTPQLGRQEKNLSVAVAAVAETTEDANAPKRADQQTGKLSFVTDDRKKFDLQDLMRASAEVLGSGNFGASYKAVLVEGEALVVKRFKQMNTVAKEDFHEHMRRLGRLKHPNILPLVAYLYRKEEKLLVFDYVYNGSLATHLHGKRSPQEQGLSWGIRLNIIKGVAQGLAYLHRELPSLTVPHAHLKSSNVLLDKYFNPVLMDYSLVPVVNPGQVQDILVAYKSPEYARHGTISKKTDVWCLGILILEIMTGKLVAKYLGQGSGLYGADLAGWINGIVSDSGSTEVFDKEIMQQECIPQMEKLLKIGIACCEEDEDKRWDLEEALGHIQQLLEYDHQ